MIESPAERFIFCLRACPVNVVLQEKRFFSRLERYGEFLGDYLAVKPGITGMWQVSGRSDTTYEERVQMDMWYVRNWSVWIDVMILWKTVAAVLLRKGAY